MSVSFQTVACEILNMRAVRERVTPFSWNIRGRKVRSHAASTTCRIIRNEIKIDRWRKALAKSAAESSGPRDFSSFLGISE
jgi:3-methyladenine DNA glycosylase Tag